MEGHPIALYPAFNQAADLLICLYAGLLVPRLKYAEIAQEMRKYPSFVGLDSRAFSGQSTFLSVDHYLALVRSDASAQQVGNYGLRAVAMLAYEDLKADTEVYDLVRKETEVSFLRHLRNAAAHGGLFHFYQREKVIDPGSVTWRGLTVDASLQGAPAFPDFFSPGDFFFLFEDISALISRGSASSTAT